MRRDSGFRLPRNLTHFEYVDRCRPTSRLANRLVTCYALFEARRDGGPVADARHHVGLATLPAQLHVALGGDAGSTNSRRPQPAYPALAHGSTSLAVPRRMHRSPSMAATGAPCRRGRLELRQAGGPARRRGSASTTSRARAVRFGRWPRTRHPDWRAPCLGRPPECDQCYPFFLPPFRRRPPTHPPLLAALRRLACFRFTNS